MADFPDTPVLLVDDEEHILTGFTAELKYNGIDNIIAVQNPEKVMEIINGNDISLVVLDLIMPGIDGETLLDSIRQSRPEIPVIVVTALDDAQRAVSCLKKGAHDYLVKPLDHGRLASICRNALKYGEMQHEITELSNRLMKKDDFSLDAFSSIVTRDAAMEAVFKYITCICKTSQPVFITGETGTGKDLVAKAIHDLSLRKGQYVKVNIAGLDDTMFTDTLFGHLKGAYTSAEQSRSGLVEKAKGGTLFLDEIGELSFLSQVKLLNLIQDREYFKIGDDTAKYSSARIIAATNLPAGKLRDPEVFRRDLYFRLMTHHINLPPLRERKTDIPPLFGHFLKKAAKELDMDVPGYDNEILKLLQNYRFPGNIRELEAMLFDAVSVFSPDRIPLSFFENHIASGLTEKSAAEENIFSGMNQLPTLKEASEFLVQEAMARTGGKQSEAAELLGISRQALNKRMKGRH
ncbi:MAG: sigma-54-dependent transcriptional regulator [Thermodesulfobacteriota bacterium]